MERVVLMTDETRILQTECFGTGAFPRSLGYAEPPALVAGVLPFPRPEAYRLGQCTLNSSRKPLRGGAPKPTKEPNPSRSLAFPIMSVHCIHAPSLLDFTWTRDSVPRLLLNLICSPSGTLAVMTLDEKIRYGMIALGGASIVLATLGVHFNPLEIVGGYGMG